MSAVLKVQEPSVRYVDALQPPLVRHFELLASAAGGVARLRELILTLAVQGKLVPQDPDDEPAGSLLERIRAQAARSTRGQDLSRSRFALGAAGEEVPSLLPRGWAWARLRDISCDHGQGVPEGDFTYIDVGSIDNKRATITGAVQILRAADAPSRARKRVEVGTVLYATVRPYLKNIAIVEKNYTPPAIASTAFAVVHPREGVSGKYLQHYLRSDVFTQFVASKMVGIAYPAINDANFFQAVIALPPVNEQERIVARADELMRLCDALEEKRQLEADQHKQLLNVLLETLANSASPEELATNWERIAANFDLLLDRPEAVEAVERTVLDLAMRGRLIEKSDAPADGEQTHGLRPGGDVIPQSELPCELPQHWAWVRLGSVAELINGDRGPNYPNKAEYVASGLPFINTGHIEPDGTLSRHSMHYLTRKKFDSLRSGKTMPGDLVYCLRGATLGKTAIVDVPEGAIASSLVIIRLSDGVEPKFAYYYLTSPLGRAMIRRFDNGSAQPNLAASSVKRYVMPLPPPAEQIRIVARVDQLRRLCADLRERLAKREEMKLRVADALVDAAAATN